MQYAGKEHTNLEQDIDQAIKGLISLVKTKYLLSFVGVKTNGYWQKGAVFHPWLSDRTGIWRSIWLLKGRPRSL
jgi:hypothetical protein